MREERVETMKKSIDVKSLLIGAVLAIAIIFSVAAANDRYTAWEYKVVMGRVMKGLEDEINRYSDQGWQFTTAAGVGEQTGFAVMRREKR
jgi:hypothetical protein